MQIVINIEETEGTATVEQREGTRSPETSPPEAEPDASPTHEFRREVSIDAGRPMGSMEEESASPRAPGTIVDEFEETTGEGMPPHVSEGRVQDVGSPRPFSKTEDVE